MLIQRNFSIFNFNYSSPEQLLRLMLSPSEQNRQRVAFSEKYLEMQQIICGQAFQSSLESRFVRLEKKKFSPETVGYGRVFLLLEEVIV